LPNLKIFMDETAYCQHRKAMIQALEPLRDSICLHLGVPRSACQLAIIPVAAMADQPTINVEIQILPSADRSRTQIEAFGSQVIDILFSKTGVPIAFRCMQHDPSTYVTLKQFASI